MSVTIKRADPNDARHVAEAVNALLAELFEAPSGGEARVQATTALLDKPDCLVAFLAWDDDAVAGALTLSTCYAVYAAGAFGEIAELYVRPDYRSRAVGKALTDAAVTHAREKGWPMLEVGAPPNDTWARTVAFYKNYGFHEVGPRLNLILKPGY